MAKIDLIRELEASGVLSSELCPTPNYWHWDVLRPQDLPTTELKREYINAGEIRWYGND